MQFILYDRRMPQKMIEHTMEPTNIQIALLRLLDRKIPEEEMLEIKRIVVKQLSIRLLDEVDKVVAEKNISSSSYKDF